MPHLGDDPVARRAAPLQQQHHIIVRPDRPSSIVRPEPNFSKMESARSSARRRQRVALTDRASMDKDERQRGSVCPKPLIFRCRTLAMTPWVAGAAASAAAASHHRPPRSPGLIVRPEPNFSKMELARSSAGGASGSRLPTARQWIKMSAREGQCALNR